MPESRGWGAPRLRSALAVYVLTDPAAAGGRTEVEVAAGVIAGGATALQLRAKGRSGRELCALGSCLGRLCRERGVLFVVNDRLDVALACGADGVHLGQDDVPVAAARAIGGDQLVIGASVATSEEAVAAWRAGANYLGVGALFATATKPDAGAPIGPAGLRGVAGSTPLPVVAIGGLRPENAGMAVAAGAAGVAAISAVVAAPDIEAATRRLASAVREALRRAGGPA